MSPPSRSASRGASALGLAVLLLVAAVAALLVWALAAPSGTPERAPEPAPGRTAPVSAAREPGPTEVVEGVERAPEAGSASAGRAALVAAIEEGEAGLAWSGLVLDARTGTPVAGARVSLTAGERAAEALSDDEGRFELAWIEALPARLAVEHPRYVDARAPTVDFEVPGRVELEPSARLSGWVEPPPEAAGARAVAWAAIASSTRSWRRLEAEVDADGRFEFVDLRPGEYALTALVPGRHVAAEAGLHLEHGEALEVPLFARPGTSLRGRLLVRGSSRAVPDAPLSVTTRDTGLPRDHRESSALTTNSDAEGRFVLEGLGPGTWRLEVVTPWGGHQTREVEVPESGGTLELDVDLVPPASVSGRVVDARGAPAARVEVVAVPSRWRDPLRGLVAGAEARGLTGTLSAADGGFELGEVPADTPLSLFARRTSEDPGAATTPLAGFTALGKLEPGSRTLGVELRLGADAPLLGVVRDPAGAPIPGASVKARAFLGGNWLVVGRGRSDEAGRFELRELCADELNLEVEHDDYLRAELRVELGGPEVEVQLEPANHLRGHAVDANGLGVPDLPLAATGCDAAGNVPENRDARVMHRTRSDAYGDFTLQGLPDGHWLVVGSSYEWMQLESSPALVFTPGDTHVELRLAPRERPLRASLVGSVVLAQGGVPEGLEVKGLHGGVVSIDGGHFKATGLVPTRHYLRIDADGHAERRVERIDLKPGLLHDLGTIELEPATRLVVRVRDADGQPVDGVRVRMGVLPSESGGAGEGARAQRLRRTGPGRYEGDDATRHAWRLVVEGKGWKRSARTLRVRERERQSVEVTLERRDG